MLLQVMVEAVAVTLVMMMAGAADAEAKALQDVEKLLLVVENVEVVVACKKMSHSRVSVSCLMYNHQRIPSVYYY